MAAPSQFVPTQVASPRASDDGEITAINRRFAEPEMCDGDEVLVRYAYATKLGGRDGLQLTSNGRSQDCRNTAKV